MRRLLLAAALFVTIPSSPALASSITINWAGTGVIFYNGDYFGNCLSGYTEFCGYGAQFQAYGIDIYAPGTIPWSVSMTFADATADANGIFSTTVDLRLEVAQFGIVNHNVPALLGNDITAPVPISAGNRFTVRTSFVTSPLSGLSSPYPSGFAMNLAGTASPGTSLVTFLRQQSLSSLSLYDACISVSDMDCDFEILGGNAVSVTVPEPSALVSLGGGALLAFGFLRRRHARPAVKRS